MPNTNTGIAPGHYDRSSISILQLAAMIPDEEAARQWFGDIFRPTGDISCLRCGSDNVYTCKHKTMRYRCRDCTRYFSCKTGPALESSPLPLKLWVRAIYFEETSLKGVSSIKPHRELGMRQATVWFMLQRIREALIVSTAGAFAGPVEVDEANMRGIGKNNHTHKKANLGRGPVGKAVVVGIRDRATRQVAAGVADRTDADPLQGFIRENIVDGAKVYTGEACAYQGLPDHEALKRSVSEYVNWQAHTNGVEPFWAALKRAYHGVYHHISPKHLQRYVEQFAGKHKIRPFDTFAQMLHIVAGMVGRKLMYKDLVAEVVGA